MEFFAILWAAPIVILGVGSLFQGVLDYRRGTPQVEITPRERMLAAHGEARRNLGNLCPRGGFPLAYHHTLQRGMMRPSELKARGIKTY